MFRISSLHYIHFQNDLIQKSLQFRNKTKGPKKLKSQELKDSEYKPRELATILYYFLFSVVTRPAEDEDTDLQGGSKTLWAVAEAQGILSRSNYPT